MRACGPGVACMRLRCTVCIRQTVDTIYHNINFTFGPSRLTAGDEHMPLVVRDVYSIGPSTVIRVSSAVSSAIAKTYWVATYWVATVTLGDDAELCMSYCLLCVYIVYISVFVKYDTALHSMT